MIASKIAICNTLKYNLCLHLKTDQKLRYFSQNIKQYDVAVIGGGIVGAGSARAILMRNPSLKLALIDKERRFGLHQTGNNSGVIHAGIYYKPGSLKAKLCVKGMKMMYQYCEEKGIKYSKCGKLIVATEKFEIPRLLNLYDRAIKNGVKDVKLVDPAEIREIERYCQGLQAIWSPHTGIVDFAQVAQSFVNDIEAGGGCTYVNFEVKEFCKSDNSEYPVIISNKKNHMIAAKYVLTCCGLQSDKVAMLTGCSEDPKIIPFRGEYLRFRNDVKNIPDIKTNIYPVPDPRFPFLGVHVTPTINGHIILGPNAVLSLCREGYRWTDINLSELKEIILYPGFRKLAVKFAVFGLKETARSFIIHLQVKNLQRFVKEINVNNVEMGVAGVRAQAMGIDGSLIEDFVFDNQSESGGIGKRVLHCRNAPSPGATSSLSIAEMIADKMEKLMKQN